MSRNLNAYFESLMHIQEELIRNSLKESTSQSSAERISFAANVDELSERYIKSTKESRTQAVRLMHV